MESQGHGGVGIGSAGHVTINLGSARAAVRSAYLQQVRRIAPPDPPGLLGREAELDELAAFCLEPDCEPYAWWQARAWAGKSALLSTFVLSQPPQLAGQIRIISFFITARLAGQDTREAFIPVLLEQLAELTGQELPAVLPEATREAYLLDLLAEAAAECQDRGERLVLVLDGLDEDRGVTTGPNAHSIAALLPADPPAGMRVIVAGRSNPPIPDDVPGWHPLRDPMILRPLQESPHARDMERLGRQELLHLLHGAPAEQDLLGLLTAAHGGLSGPDLEELTGASLGEIEEIMNTVAGRTFTLRASQGIPGTGPEMYLLGHEELQLAATRYIGRRLAGYRDRLHGWADRYRSQGWPPGTPEYLLTSYYRLLTDLGDQPRMISFAGDTARHDRLLDLTGGDAAALAEIGAALDLIAVQEAPDLASALSLACLRDLLTDRNTRIPPGLPAVWAALGQVTRAEALGTSIPDPERQAEALVLIAEALTRTGQDEQGTRFADKAAAVARTIPNPDMQTQALTRIAGALTRAGQHEHAEAVARTISDPDMQAETLARIGEALTRAGQHERAEAVVRLIRDPRRRADALARAQSIKDRTDPERAARNAAQAEALSRMSQDRLRLRVTPAWADGRSAGSGQRERAAGDIAQKLAFLRAVSPVPQADDLAQLAEELAEAGEYEHAVRAAGQAEAATRSVSDLKWRAEILVQIAAVLARAGQHKRAGKIIDSIGDPGLGAETLVRIAGVLAATGNHERAAEVAAQAVALSRTTASPGRQAQALARVAEGLAQSGQHEQAVRFAGQAEAIARTIPDRYQREEALVWVAEALAGTGQREQAAIAAEYGGMIAGSTPDPDGLAETLVKVAEALAAAGHHGQAARVARQAEMIAHSNPGAFWRAEALAWVAEALVRAEQYEQAEAIARSAVSPVRRAEALARVAEALAGAGQHERAVMAAKQAEAIAGTIPGAFRQAESLVRITGALAEAGKYEEAEAAARSILDPVRRAEALARVEGTLAGAGQRWRAARVAGQAEAIARHFASPVRRANALARVAEGFAEAGQAERAARIAGQAETVARSLPDPVRRAAALVQVAEALARTGDTRSASCMAAATCAAGRWTTVTPSILLLDPSAFSALARVLDEMWNLQLSH